MKIIKRNGEEAIFDIRKIETAISNVMKTVEDDSNTEEILRKALYSLSM